MTHEVKPTDEVPPALTPSRKPATREELEKWLDEEEDAAEVEAAEHSLIQALAKRTSPTVENLEVRVSRLEQAAIRLFADVYDPFESDEETDEEEKESEVDRYYAIGAGIFDRDIARGQGTRPATSIARASCEQHALVLVGRLNEVSKVDTAPWVRKAIETLTARLDRVEGKSTEDSPDLLEEPECEPVKSYEVDGSSIGFRLGGETLAVVHLRDNGTAFHVKRLLNTWRTGKQPARRVTAVEFAVEMHSVSLANRNKVPHVVRYTEFDSGSPIPRGSAMWAVQDAHSALVIVTELNDYAKAAKVYKRGAGAR